MLPMHPYVMFQHLSKRTKKVCCVPLNVIHVLIMRPGWEYWVGPLSQK